MLLKEIIKQHIVNYWYLVLEKNWKMLSQQKVCAHKLKKNK